MRPAGEVRWKRVSEVLCRSSASMKRRLAVFVPKRSCVQLCSAKLSDPFFIGPWVRIPRGQHLDMAERVGSARSARALLVPRKSSGPQSPKRSCVQLCSAKLSNPLFHWLVVSNPDRATLELAERVGFEPTSPVRGCRFSRPVHSTALPPLPRTRNAGASYCKAEGFSSVLAYG